MVLAADRQLHRQEDRKREREGEKERELSVRLRQRQTGCTVQHLGERQLLADATTNTQRYNWSRYNLPCIIMPSELNFLYWLSFVRWHRWLNQHSLHILMLDLKMVWFMGSTCIKTWVWNVITFSFPLFLFFFLYISEIETNSFVQHLEPRSYSHLGHRCSTPGPGATSSTWTLTSGPWLDVTKLL